MKLLKSNILQLICGLLSIQRVDSGALNTNFIILIEHLTENDSTMVAIFQSALRRHNPWFSFVIPPNDNFKQPRG